MSFPLIPLANEFVRIEDKDTEQELFPLDLLMCSSCRHLQVEALVNPARLFGDYVYVSGTSPITREHFERYAAEIEERFNPRFVVEIGSNDGTMLKALRSFGIEAIGVDPAKAIANKATSEGAPTIPEFFDARLAQRIVSERGHPDVVIANNVFAHAEDLVEMAKGAKILMGDSGVLILEVVHLLDVFEHNLFDTFYHEHSSHHALSPIIDTFPALGLHVHHVEKRAGQLGRGSIRIYANGDGRRMIDPSVAQVRLLESHVGLFAASTYAAWSERIERLGAFMRNKLEALRLSGASIAGFGAPAKLTMLQYTLGIGRDDCEFVVDDSPWKQGLLTPGLHIPILHPDELVRRAPDVCVIYAWNFADDIMRRFADKLPATKWIVPLPFFREVTRR